MHDKCGFEGCKSGLLSEQNVGGAGYSSASGIIPGVVQPAVSNEERNYSSSWFTTVKFRLYFDPQAVIGESETVFTVFSLQLEIVSVGP